MANLSNMPPMGAEGVPTPKRAKLDSTNSDTSGEWTLGEVAGQTGGLANVILRGWVSSLQKLDSNPVDIRFGGLYVDWRKLDRSLILEQFCIIGSVYTVYSIAFGRPFEYCT